jgi:micrococcal nuclease
LEIRPAGITFPKIAQGYDPAQPLAEIVWINLAELAIEKSLILYLGTKRQDRHDRVLAHPSLESELWVENSVGAWASPSVDNARVRKVGIWGERFFRVRNPHEMQRDIDTFQIIEGRVISDVIVKGRAYLNFKQN